MAVTVADIQAREEFASVSPGLIEQSIAEAETLVNRTAYGAQGDLAVKYTAMHVVAMSPYGEAMRLSPKDQKDGSTTIYQRLFKMIERRLGPGGPVVV